MYHRNDLSLDGFSTCHSNLTHLARGEKLYLTISVPPPAKCSWKYILFNSVLVLVRKNISYPRTRWVAHFFYPLLFQCSATDVHLERKGEVCWGGEGGKLCVPWGPLLVCESLEAKHIVDHTSIASTLVTRRTEVAQSVHTGVLTPNIVWFV